MPLTKPSRRHETLQLQFPIEVAGEQVSTLYVMVPRGLELQLLPAGDNGKMKAGDIHPFAAKICGITVDDINKLEVEDYVALMSVVEAMQSRTPPSGQRNAPSSAGT